jgi:hypothetical protein
MITIIITSNINDYKLRSSVPSQTQVFGVWFPNNNKNNNIKILTQVLIVFTF